jgi:hypothetical protein
MSETPDWAKFGPDATFSAVAEWLTENASFIDDIFLKLLGFTHIRLSERMTKQHPNFGQMLHPKLEVDFQSEDLAGDKFPRSPYIRAILDPIIDHLRGEFAALKQRCVVRNDLFYQEAFELTIWQGSGVFGSLRYPPIGDIERIPDYEVAEQYFIWTRRGNRYVGDRLEIRLWGQYLPDFLDEDGDALREIQEMPARLLTSPDILPGRDNGYIALYQMQRPPTRVDLGRKSISAIFEGEYEAAKAAVRLHGA